MSIPARNQRRGQLEKMNRPDLVKIHEKYQEDCVVWVKHPVRGWRKDEIVSSILDVEFGYEGADVPDVGYFA